MTEARVDWEKEAMGIVHKMFSDEDGKYFQSPLHEEDIKLITKALSAAFEKGREAR